MLAVQYKSQLCRLCAQPVPVKGSWTLAIWLPDVPLLPPVPSVETRVSCVNLLPHITQEIRGGRCLNTPQVFFCCSPCQAAGHFELPRGVFPSDWGWARASKKEGRFSFLDVMPSSHTPFGPWRKTSSKEKDPGAQIAPRLTRKMPEFSVVIRNVEVFFFFLVFACGSHKSMATAMLLVCGEDSE